MNHPHLRLLVLPLCLALGAACESGSPAEEPQEGAQVDSYDCTQSSECSAGQECSGGGCVAVVACTSAAECGGGQECIAGVCRSLCQSDADCGALVCDLVTSHCMPKENPSLGTGGAGNQGTGGGGTGASGSGGSETNPEGLDYEIIDDLEDGDIAILPTDGRVGYWYAYNEEAPRPLAELPVASEGGLAMHASGSHMGGVAADAAYGGMGVDLKNANTDGLQPGSQDRLTYDASAWDGIEFRVKGDGSTKSVRFEVVTSDVASGEEGGTCATGCFDAHGRDVALGSEWTTVKVPFASLVQEGWGQATDFDASKILGLAWEDLSTNDWDFWIDDLKFYLEGPGTDPGGETPNDCGDSWGEESNGSVTWYTFDQGTDDFGDVNCSYGITVGNGGNGDKVNHVYTGDGGYFGAIATSDYNQAAACGACAEVTRDGSKSVVVTIVDQCPIGSNPKCVKGHIDLSKAAFLELGAESEGYLGQRAGNGTITWKYVDCPVPGDVQFRLKEPSNSNWNMVIVENHAYPIASVQVQVDGAWLNASREEYNFWLPPGGRFGAQSYQVRAIDINGNTVQGSLTLSGVSQTSGAQFVCQ